ncbi:hypothetical protein FQA39_LY14875 [Lamprigera yunnana]|nr:hypothetical protein FQA39_LY14875 [Lamprigera yunnana]
MFKLSAILAVFVFQVALSSTFIGNEELELGLKRVREEVSDLTTYLQTSFPNSHHAVDTITWQCHRVAETIQGIINKLKQEISKRDGDVQFKRFWFMLQEVHTSLQQLALSTDVTEVTHIKSQLILNLQLSLEALEKILHTVYVHYPDFRATLKIVFDDFLEGIRVISKNIELEWNEKVVQLSTTDLAKKIGLLTQSLLYNNEVDSEILKMYLRRVQRVTKKLDAVRTVGDDEIDVVLTRLWRKLKNLFNVVGEMNKVEMSTYLTDVAILYKQLVHFTENGSQNESSDKFIVEVMLEYYHVLEEVLFGALVISHSKEGLSHL